MAPVPDSGCGVLPRMGLARSRRGRGVIPSRWLSVEAAGGTTPVPRVGRVKPVGMRQEKTHRFRRRRRQDGVGAKAEPGQVS